MRIIETVQTLPRGFTTRQIGNFVPAITGTAFPLTITTRWLHLKTRTTNTDTIYFGMTTTAATSTVGYALQSGVTVELPIDATSLSLYFISAGGSSVVDYIALGSPLAGS